MVYMDHFSPATQEDFVDGKWEMAFGVHATVKQGVITVIMNRKFHTSLQPCPKGFLTTGMGVL